MKIIDINNKDSIQNAARVLKEGGILVFSTDTVYGIGCLMDKRAIRRLYKIKNRPLNQPTAILCIQNLIPKMRSSTIKGDIKHDFYKGGVTLLISKNLFEMDIPQNLIKDNKVGIRLPKYRWLEKLINMAGPIVASSANKKGEPAPSSFGEIDKEILHQADLAIKTDKKLPGLPSRVYDLELKKYLR